MRVRKLDKTGDMTFGNGSANMLIDTGEAVLQNVYTRLKLFFGEWYLNSSDGTQWLEKCLQKNTLASAKAEIKQRILNTQGVKSVDSLTLNLDENTRNVQAVGQITTIYGIKDFNFKIDY